MSIDGSRSLQRLSKTFIDRAIKNSEEGSLSQAAGGGGGGGGEITANFPKILLKLKEPYVLTLSPPPPPPPPAACERDPFPLFFIHSSTASYVTLLRSRHEQVSPLRTTAVAIDGHISPSTTTSVAIVAANVLDRRRQRLLNLETDSECRRHGLERRR